MKNIRLFLSAAVVLFLPATPLLLAANMNQPGAADAPAPAPAGAPQFSEAIEDLPLMPGLQLAEDKDVLFATPHSGRIASSTASGVVDVDQVYEFYKKTLPSLGWKPLDARTYQREGDKLSIEARARDKTTTVKFTVTPAN